MLEDNKLKQLLEAILLAADKPLTEEQMLALFLEEEKPSLGVLREALRELQEDMQERAFELVQVASGYRFQVKTEFSPWVSRLWEEKAQRYSRALLETLALIAYRQPITRGEIEDIRGVAVSSHIIKTLLDDREWIRVVGHREVPGRPALYATTKIFLDYFGLKSLQELPPLPEILNLDTVTLGLEEGVAAEALAAEMAGDSEEGRLHISMPVLGKADMELEEELEEELDEMEDEIEEELEEDLDDEIEVEDEVEEEIEEDFETDPLEEDEEINAEA